MLQIYVKNNIRIRDASTPLRAAVTKALTQDNPAYVEALKKRRPTWGLDPKITVFIMDMGDLIAPRGFLLELRAILTAQGITPEKVITMDLTEGQAVDFGPWNDMYKLRPYQEPYVKALVAANGIGVAPAGAGKTIMGCKVILEIGRPTLWLTHTKDLMYQTRDRVEATLKGVGTVGIIGDAVQQWGSGKMLIATVQTLQANPKLIDALDGIIGLVVIDEAHHFPANQFIETVAKFSAARVVGLTATPDRRDRLEFLMYFGIGPILATIDRGNLYDGGSLLKPEVKFIFTKFDYEQASLRDGSNVDAGGEDLDYNALTQELYKDKERGILVANTILDYIDRGTSLVLTESVRYLYYLRDYVAAQAKLRGLKVPRMAVVHGGLTHYSWRVAANQKEGIRLVEAGQAIDYRNNPRLRRWEVKVAQYSEKEFTDWQVTNKARKELLAAVRLKKYDILFATQLAREGLDIDHLTVEHMATPKRGDDADKNNGSAVEQELGRIQRPDPHNPGKAPILIDYVDYEVGVFQGQYYSRRKVYKRLGLVVPGKTKKPKDAERDFFDTFLGGLPL